MIIECPICKESILILLYGNVLPISKGLGGNGMLFCSNCNKLFSLYFANKTKKDVKKVKNKWILEDDFIFTLEESKEEYDIYNRVPFTLAYTYCPICKEGNVCILHEVCPIEIPYRFYIKGKEVFGCKNCNKIFLANLEERIKRIGIRKFKKMKNKWIHKTKMVFTIQEYSKNMKDYDKCYNAFQERMKEYLENIKKWGLIKNGKRF